jgi:ParB-like chromosome segregation protein Spo0J
MKVLAQKYRLTPLAELKPHPRNPRKHADSALEESMAANGFYGAVVAQKSTGYILAGHARVERARAGKLEALPVIWVDVDDAGALKILAADNRTSDLAAQVGYDEQKLAELLTAVRAETGGFEGTGFTEESFDALLKSMGDAIAGADAGSTPKRRQRRHVGTDALPPAPGDPAPGDPQSDVCPLCGRSSAAAAPSEDE